MMLASLLLAVTTPTPALAATIGGRPAPYVWDVVPRTGEVVGAGTVRLNGTAVSETGIRSAEFLLDGTPVPTEIIDQNDVAARVQAAVEVEPGEYLVELRAIAGDGSEIRRPWRFAAAGASLHRLAGDDRYATAARIAAHGREPKAAPAAVLARGDDHADALAGAPLAHHLDGPLLLTTPNGLPGVTAAALTDLVAPGGTIHLLGGTAAVSPGVAQAVRDLGFEVTRHAGSNRFETAASIMQSLPASDTVVMASATSFADALAAAAPAASSGHPILLSGRDTLPAATATALAEISTVRLVGGEAVLGQQVFAEVDAVAGEVTRVAGSDRYATAHEVIKVYELDAAVPVGLADGRDFADALAGSVHAARAGTGILLTESTRLPNPTVAALRRLSPSGVMVFGGGAAVDRSTANEARAALLGRASRLIDEAPASSEEIHALDQFTFQFGHEIEAPATSMSVYFDGRELPTSFGTGDFEDTLVLSVGGLPADPPLDEAIPVRVVGQVRTSEGFTHIDREFTFRKNSMTSGDVGPTVKDLQDRLLSLGYWLDNADGAYGSLTVQAVMAFQKYEGLEVTGAADDATLARLAVASRPVPADAGPWHAEVDKTRQVLMFAENGVTRWTFNTSTGTEKPYNEPGGSGISDTPTGTFHVCRQVDGMREGDLGNLWRPKYYDCGSGIAIHGSGSVPAYPASHGCVRVTNTAINFIWSNNMLPMGARVIVYGRFPGT